MPAFLVKEFKGSLVDEQNFSLVIQQDQAFLNGFKYLLEKTLLFRQLDKKALEILRKKHPAFAYGINRNPLLRILDLCPKRLQLFAIRQVLKQEK